MAVQLLRFKSGILFAVFLRDLHLHSRLSFSVANVNPEMVLPIEPKVVQ